MVKIKQKDLLNVNASLVYLSNEGTSAWYQVAKNIRIIKKHIMEYEESHKSIMDKLADKNKDGTVKINDKGQVSFGKNLDKANDMYISLMEEDVDVNFYTFSFDKIGDSKLESLKIEPLLDVIIVDE